jgi:hypothetical protein
MQVPCDKVYTRTLTSSTTTTTSTAWYSDLSVSGVDPTAAPHITVVACDYQCFGSTCPAATPPCPAGFTCTDSGTPPPRLRCTSAVVAPNFDAGRLVVACGAQTQSTTGGQPSQQSGYRYMNVYVRIG